MRPRYDTMAHAMAERYNDDGETFVRRGVTLDAACAADMALMDCNSRRKRRSWTFADGSALVIADDNVWDICHHKCACGFCMDSEGTACPPGAAREGGQS